MKTVAFIFARGGSKGIPGKNSHMLGGKPLIAWSIEQALSVAQVDKVIVSTDSEEIAAIAISYGAEVPFTRPIELSNDDSPEWLAWQHGLNYLRQNFDDTPEYIVVVPATAPLRMPVDIENCIHEYEKGGADVVITITDSHRNPSFNMVRPNPDGTFGLVNPPVVRNHHRQSVDIVYDMTTVCYVVSSDFLMSNNSLFEGRMRAVHVPLERAVDIDNFLDLQIAEMLLQKRLV